MLGEVCGPDIDILCLRITGQATCCTSLVRVSSPDGFTYVSFQLFFVLSERVEGPHLARRHQQPARSIKMVNLSAIVMRRISLQLPAESASKGRLIEHHPFLKTRNATFEHCWMYDCAGRRYVFERFNEEQRTGFDHFTTIPLIQVPASCNADD